jgi:DNA polymerase-1
MYGRKRFIPGINDLNAIIKNAAKREAMNMPIQGTSADIIKLSMIEIDKYMKSENLKSIMIMQVHDELVFDVYP